MGNKKQIPIYLQLIKTVTSGFSALDENSQQQIADFVKTQQHKNGGFVDRAGSSDLYYSLFGFWICSAADFTDLIENHKKFIKNKLEFQPDGIIDKMALVLIQIGLFGAKSGVTVFSILKKGIAEGGKINLSYRFFLLMLIIDAKNKHKIMVNSLARIGLLFYKLPKNVPCSIIAAYTFAKNQVGLNIKKEQEKLLSFYKNGVGFTSFGQVKNADMLSTAVALFVLQKTDYDLRMIVPDCLLFIEQNYDDGAFLSGDGDKTKDLEYLFYGLLALGTLVESYDK